MASKIWSERELKVLANRIRMVRKMLGLTQAEFAERTYFSSAHISKVERGKMRTSQKMISRIELAFGVDISEDLSDEKWNPWDNTSLKKLSKHMTYEYDGLPPITRRIYELLKKRNIRQRELAERIGVTTATTSEWKKKGRTPNSDKIIPICTALNVTPYYLLVGKEEGVPYPEEYL